MKETELHALIDTIHPFVTHVQRTRRLIARLARLQSAYHAIAIQYANILPAAYLTSFLGWLDEEIEIASDMNEAFQQMGADYQRFVDILQRLDIDD